MAKARMFRGRSSYKTSDVAALFLVGLFLGGFTCLLMWLLTYLYNRMFGGA